MASKLNPPALRQFFRQGNDFMGHTFGRCGGYLQANMVMMPSRVAQKFNEFCLKNYAPCPLVCKSKIGEFGAPLLGDDVDIRADLPAYRVYQNGELSKTVPDLKDMLWDDMVSFYLGCSFSFDDKLLESGIKLDQSKNVAMFLTNIDCIPVPPFSTKMVVSMRPIPRHQLHLAVKSTINLDFAHGAPIYIGSPDAIGINDLSDNIMKQEVAALGNDEVPVFWACGVTSGYAVKSANLPECYSHSPGGMFVSDVLSDDVPKLIENTQYPNPVVVALDDSKTTYSILSERVADNLKKIETEMMEDPGNRGIETLLVEDDFAKACLHVAKNGSNIVIILGFQCFQDKDPFEENDGVAGAIYIAKALVTLGKNVTFVIDSYSETMKKLLKSAVPESEVKWIGQNYKKDDNFLFDKKTGEALYSHLISIERPSPSTDGHYHRATGKNILGCDPIHLLFEQAQGKITTIGIGDGGNELGMGKVHQQVVDNVKNGHIVASAISCDYLITCGVSNWGGFGMASGLYALSKCPVFDRYRRFGLGKHEEVPMEDVVFSKEKDEELNISVRDHGFRDGVSGACALTVDNLDYYNVHVKKFETMRCLAKAFP